jgi:hypothetical protein
MNRSDQDRLVDEILQTDELADLRQASLEKGLSALHQRQLRRRALRICAMGAGPVILALAALVWIRVTFLGKPNPGSASPVVSVPAAPAKADPIKFIDDEQLLALFPDRPVALIGKPGQQELVFLDELAAAHRVAEADLDKAVRF